MKKIRFGFLVIFVLIITGLVTTNYAYTQSSTQEYNRERDFRIKLLDDGTVEITRYRGRRQIVNIPPQINGLPVSSIGGGIWINSKIKGGAFSNNKNIISVIIPNSVTSIGKYAFYGTTSLTSVNIPDSLTTIGDNAFQGCTSLASVTIPDSVITIGNSTFAHCTSLVSVIIPDSVTSIGVGAFVFNTSLTSVIIPDSVTSIGNAAFAGCTSLTNVTLGNGITRIEPRTFANCTSLTSIIIPDSVTHIGNEAFDDCRRLNNVTIPDSVIHIGGSAFRNTNLRIVTIPNRNAVILSRAFPDNTRIIKEESEAQERVRLTQERAQEREQERIRRIIEQAPERSPFHGRWRHTAYRTISYIMREHKPASLRDGVWYFPYIDHNLTRTETTHTVYSFNRGQFTKTIDLIDGGLSKKQEETGFIVSYSENRIELDNGTVLILLENGTIRDSERRDFSLLSAFEIVVSEPVIENGAFRGRQLTFLILTENVNTIGDSAFENNRLTSVIIPSSVTTIGNRAFIINQSLTNVIFERSGIRIQSNAFPGGNNLRTVYQAGGIGTYTRKENGEVWTKVSD